MTCHHLLVRSNSLTLIRCDESFQLVIQLTPRLTTPLLVSWLRRWQTLIACSTSIVTYASTLACGVASCSPLDRLLYHESCYLPFNIAIERQYLSTSFLRFRGLCMYNVRSLLLHPLLPLGRTTAVSAVTNMFLCDDDDDDDVYNAICASPLAVLHLLHTFNTSPSINALS